MPRQMKSLLAANQCNQRLLNQAYNLGLEACPDEDSGKVLVVLTLWVLHMVPPHALHQN